MHAYPLHFRPSAPPFRRLSTPASRPHGTRAPPSPSSEDREKAIDTPHPAPRDHDRKKEKKIEIKKSGLRVFRSSLSLLPVSPGPLAIPGVLVLVLVRIRIWVLVQ